MPRFAGGAICLRSAREAGVSRALLAHSRRQLDRYMWTPPPGSFIRARRRDFLCRKWALGSLAIRSAVLVDVARAEMRAIPFFGGDRRPTSEKGQ